MVVVNVHSQDVGYLDNDDTEGFGPENYIMFNGLSEDAAIGEYIVQVRLSSSYVETTWTLTARINDDIVWVEEGDFAPDSFPASTRDDSSRRRRLSTTSSTIDNPRIASEVFTVTLGSYTSVDC